MSDVRCEIGRKGILAMLRDYDGTFGPECVACPRCCDPSRVMNIWRVGALDRRRRLRNDICRVQFWRKDAGHEFKLRFSVKAPAITIGEWTVKHYGDPVYVKTLRTQMALAEGA